MRKHFFAVTVTEHYNRLPREAIYLSLPPWRYSKAAWMWSWATSSRWPCLSRVLDKVTSRSPFQPQPSRDSVNPEATH